MLPALAAEARGLMCDALTPADVAPLLWRAQASTPPRMHACMHARMHVPMHACIHAPMHARVRVRVRLCVRLCMRACMRVQAECEGEALQMIFGWAVEHFEEVTHTPNPNLTPCYGSTCM